MLALLIEICFLVEYGYDRVGVTAPEQKLNFP